MEKLQAAYHGIIPIITDRGQWPEVDKGFKLWPPTSKKDRPPSRQKKNRYPAPSEKKGEATRQLQSDVEPVEVQAAEPSSPPRAMR